MPTLDKRLLAWSDEDDVDEYDAQTAASWDDDHLAVDDGDDRCAAVSVDDVLVPVTNNGLDGGGARPSSGTRKACAVAGLGAVGCACAYLAWLCATTARSSNLPVLS